MILCIDVGTSLIKAGLFDHNGLQVSAAQAEITLSARPPNLYEVDVDQWWAGLKNVTAELSSLHEVEAVVISGNAPTIVPIGRDGNALHPAVTWMDRRGQAEALEEAGDLDVDTSFYLSKIFWFRRHRPDLYQRTRWFLSCPEYLDWRLTGVACTTLPTPAYDRYVWKPEALSRLDLDPEKMPPFVVTGQVLGHVSAAAAEEIGISTGTPVVAAGPDFIVSLLGTATVDHGATCDRAGSSEGVNHCSDGFVDDTRLVVLPHIAPDHWNVSGLISTTGKAVAWFRETLGTPAIPYEQLYSAVAETAPGAAGLVFLPYLAGERSPHWDGDARGAFLGLNLSHTWREMARAVVESVGLAIRDTLELFRENGLTAAAMRVAGTQARSAVLNQIKADVTGVPLEIPAVIESELMGNACLGLAGLGRYRDPLEAARACVRVERVFEPDPSRRDLYGELYQTYRSLYPALRGFFPRLQEATPAEDTQPGAKESRKR